MKKIFKFLLISFLIIFSFIIISIFFFLKPISEQSLRLAGFKSPQIDMASYTPDRGFVFQNIQLDENNKIEALELIPFKSLTVTKPVLTFSADEKFANISLKNKKQAKGAVHIPFQTITVKEAVITLASPSLPPLTMNINGIMSDRGDHYQWTSDLTGKNETLMLDAHATMTIQKTDGTTNGHLEIKKSHINTEDITAKRISGWITVEGENVDGQLTSGATRAWGVPFKTATLSLQQKNDKATLLLNTAITENAERGAGTQLNLDASYDPKTKEALLVLNVQNTATESKPWLVPFKLSAKAKQNGSAVNFKGHITEPNGSFYINLNGGYDILTAKGQLAFDMPPLTFMKGVSSLKDISPASVAYLDDTSGTIGFNAALTLESGIPVTSTAEILLKQFSAKHKDLRFENINTVLRFGSLMPPVFSNQKIAIGLLDAGVPLTNNHIKLSLDQKKNVTIHDMRSTLADGALTTDPFTLSLKDMKLDVVIKATDMDLTKLFSFAPTEGLDATGKVNGSIPVQIRKDSVTIKDGILETTGTGTIRYNPTEVPAFLQDPSQKQIIDLRVALTAFEYDSLKLALDGKLGGDQKIGLHAKGRNPAFYEGHDVNLNFTVEGPLENVLKYNPGGSQIPDAVQKQIEAYEKKHAKK